LLSHVHRKPEKLSIQLPPETMARLRSAAEVPLRRSPRTSDEVPSRCCAAARGPHLEGPVFLFLRNLLADAGRLIEAWESGEPALTLMFGTHDCAGT